MGVLGLKTPKREKSVLSLLYDIGLNLSLHAASIVHAHLEREFQITIKMHLFWCQAGELFAVVEPWRRAACVPWQRRAGASERRLEPCDESWGLYQQAIPPCTPLPLQFFRFVSYSYGQGEFRRTPASQARWDAAGHSSIRKVAIICCGLYQIWANWR